MIPLPEDMCNAEHASTLRCPTCLCLRTLRPHGGYWRHVARLLGDGSVEELTKRIVRVRCKACGVTHALLPFCLVPWSPFTVALCLVAVSRCLAGERVASVAADLHAGPTSVRKMLADARRVVSSTGSPCGGGPMSAAEAETASRALAETASDEEAFAQKFWRAHRTAPFSRIPLPWWRRRGPGWVPPQHSVGAPGAPEAP